MPLVVDSNFFLKWDPFAYLFSWFCSIHTHLSFLSSHLCDPLYWINFIKYLQQHFIINYKFPWVPYFFSLNFLTLFGIYDMFSLFSFPYVLWFFSNLFFICSFSWFLFCLPWVVLDNLLTTCSAMCVHSQSLQFHFIWNLLAAVSLLLSVCPFFLPQYNQREE